MARNRLQQHEQGDDPQTVNDFYTYSQAFQFVALGQTLSLNIGIQADSDFVAVKIMATSTDTVPGPIDAQGGGLLQIVDNGSQRRLFDQPEPLASIAGTAQRPFIMPWVHRFPRQGGVNLQLTNTGLAAQLVRITIAGYKIIPESRL